MRIRDPLPILARGKVRVTAEDRDGKRTELETSNTVVEGFYIWALRQATIPPAPGTVDTYRELPARVVLGSNPEPTNWDMTFGEVVEEATADLLPNTGAPDVLSLTLSTMFDFGDGNGDGGDPKTYWEIALVTDASRLLARVVGRNTDGTPAGLTKSERQRLYIDWTIYWVVE